MNGAGESSRVPSFFLRSYRVQVAAGVVAGLALVALVGQAVLTNPRPNPTGPIAVGSPSAAPSVSPSTPAETEGPWAELEVPPYEPVAELIPADRDRLGIAGGTAFEVRSKTAAPAVDLAAGLTVRPRIAFSVEPGADPTRAIVRPTKALEPGTRYRWELTAIDGSLAGSWLFTVRQPLHVVTTLPGDQAVQVPLNTGIEVTFDQDGTTGVADHISLAPIVAGRFEQHGRTWAFVPEHPLAERTIYTVTVRAGVGASGSSETLETDVSFRFETGTATRTPPRIDFVRPILEVRPGVQPVVVVSTPYSDEDEEERPSGGPLTIDVYRLPSFDAAADAARRLSGAVGWAVASPDALVATAGLSRVDRVQTATVDGGGDAGQIVPVPVTLTTGWYLLAIEQPGGSAQMLLQVTDVAAYALLSTETLVVWANDLDSGSVMPDATVRTASGKLLGTTAANGTVRIPAAEVAVAPRASYDDRPSPATLLEVRASDGRAVIVALGMPFNWGYDDYRLSSGYSGPAYWTLFRTDRSTYRQTDTVHVTGLLRTRSDRSIPTNVSVRLLHWQGDADVPILSVPVTLSARGTFTADLRLADLPRTGYRLELLVGRTMVSSAWITVAEIRKPAYEIDVTTDRNVYVVGETVKVSATVTFYDGTAAPGLDVHIYGFGTSKDQVTDAAGHVSTTLVAAFEDDSESEGGSFSTTVGVRPVRPEEGQISGEAEVLLLPSRVWVTGTGVLDGDHIFIDGKLSWADIAALEAARARGAYLEDPSGTPIATRTLSIDVFRTIERRTQVGTRYDYIEKKVVPRYETDYDRVKLGTYPVTSDGSGGFHLSVVAPSTTDGYEAVISAKDPEGRQFRRWAWVEHKVPTLNQRLPYLVDGGGCGSGPWVMVGLGDRVDATMHAGDGSVATGGQFLYVISRRGALDVTVQDTASFRPLFRDADLPSVDIVGVWRTNDGFAVASVLARVDGEDKRIGITIRPDAARYHPGDTVTVRVTTTGPNGDPIAADVILQGVDQKLYTLGQAYDADPVGDLFESTGSGIVQSFSSHAALMEDTGGCGDEGGGGGDRTDFRDAVTFQRITTDASGQGTATFRLSDDLTSWHLTATAAASSLDVGQGSVLIPVGLDFFAEPVLAPEYLAGDQPVLRIRGYGDSLDSGDPIRFVVTSPTLQLNATVTGTAFQAASVQLPVLAAGRHKVTIAAEATHDGRVLRDTLTRTITVVPSRLTALAGSVDVLGAGYAPRGGGPGMTTYVVTDAGRGSLISLLQQLASSSSARFDGSAAADLARSILIDEFGLDPGVLAPTGYDAARYQRGGIALLPYAGVDLELTALAAITVSTRLSSSDLADWLEYNAETSTRERQLQVLVARAGLGHDVAADLQGFDAAGLTIRERLWLALGLAAVGDDDAARAIERDLLEQDGQRLGQWVRLQVGSSREDSLEASGLLLVLAGRLGDPLAADVARYLVEQQSDEHVFPLQLAAYAEATLHRLPRTAAKFAYTIEGARREVALEPGGSFTLTLVPSEVASLRLEPLEGKLEVVTSWQTTDVPTTNAPGLVVTRTVTPEVGSVDGRLVRVTLTVQFGPQAPKGCYVLTDLLPSGLAPMATTAGWSDESDEEGEPTGHVVGPYEVDGQRVSWCVDPAHPERTFGYAARVVTPGTYRWEPAVLQALDAPELRSATEETTFTIR